MKTLKWVLLSAATSLSALNSLGVTGTVPRSSTTLAHGDFEGNVATAVQWVSATYKVPMIVELAQPIPESVHIKAAVEPLSAVLDHLAHQAPDYASETKQGIILFYNKRARNWPGNILNIRVRWFSMPSDVGELKLQLKEVLADPDRRTAPLAAGIVDPELSKLKLVEGKALTDVTGREILIEAASEARTLFTIIVFPNDSPSRSDVETAEANWFWATPQKLRSQPIELKSLPSSRAKNVSK